MRVIEGSNFNFREKANNLTCFSCNFSVDLKVILLPISVGIVLIPILCLISWWRTRRVWRDAMQSRCSLSSNRDNHNLEALPIDAQYETSFAQDADNIVSYFN